MFPDDSRFIDGIFTGQDIDLLPGLDNYRVV